MTIVSPAPESEPLLEVVVTQARDASAATSGEADRLLVLAEPESGGRSQWLAALMLGVMLVLALLIASWVLRACPPFEPSTSLT
ncbi:MAG: hypothetical protein ACJ72D_10495, partial [Marmoricola sp.]